MTRHLSHCSFVRRAAVLVLVASFVAWLSVATGARADLLELDPTGRPDVYADWISVSYSSGHLSVLGYVETFDVDHVAPIDYWNTSGSNAFQIEMDVSSAGVPGTGTLTVSGGFDGIGEGTLLTGTIAEFGFSDTGATDRLEFVFDVTGGLLNTSEWFSLQAGVLLHETGFSGSWASDFANDGWSGYSDTFALPVPEPSSLAMSLFAAVACIAVLGRRLRRA